MSRVLQGRGGGGSGVLGAADDGSGGIEGDGVVTCAVNKTLAWFRVGGGWRGQKRWRT